MQASVYNAVEADKMANKKIDNLTPLDNKALSDSIMSNSEKEHAKTEV